MEKQLEPPEQLRIEFRAALSTFPRQVLTEGNMKLGSENMGFIMMLNFL